jgi:hypothetical protein
MVVKKDGMAITANTKIRMIISPKCADLILIPVAADFPLQWSEFSYGANSATKAW